MLDAVSFYKCLSDETRLKSLLLILDHKELCVCDLTDALGLSQPKISRHLAELRKCNLVTTQRRGKWMYYRINKELATWKKSVLRLSLKNSKEELEENSNNLAAQSKQCC